MSLSWFVGTVMLGFLVQLGIVYPVFLILAGRRRPGPFFRGARDAMLVAFGTSSSNATLPTSLRVATERLGISPSVARFVLAACVGGDRHANA